MGKRGPKTKPTAIKRLEGNPGKRTLPENEPEFSEANVLCPQYLSESAKKIWQRVEGELRSARLLTAVDVDALAVYCTAVADHIDADEKLQKFGTVVRQGPQVIPSPYINIKNKAALLIARFGREFGFTPSSRADLGVIPKRSKESEFEKKRKAKLQGGGT